jgi:phosphoribosyl 1,2-cyclic phosphodiesterase
MKAGYTADGEYYQGQEKHFKGCDYLVVNCHRPKDSPLKGYMDSEGARKLIEGVKPQKAILTHFGMKMMRGVAEKEAVWIEKKTGVKTTAARDGMSVGPEAPQKKNLGKFLI